MASENDGLTRLPFTTKAELLADFLAHNDCQTLYLVGDIVDGWALRSWWCCAA